MFSFMIPFQDRFNLISIQKSSLISFILINFILLLLSNLSLSAEVPLKSSNFLLKGKLF